MSGKKAAKNRRVRAGAEQEYATFLQAMTKLQNWGGLAGPLCSEEIKLLHAIGRDIMQGNDPGARFFQPLEGQPGGFRPIAIAMDHLVRSDKAVARRWGLSAGRVRKLSAEHRNSAIELIAGLSNEERERFIDRLCEVYRSPTR